MSLASNLIDAFTRVGTEFKAIRVLISGSGTGDVSALDTTATDLVGAVNEALAAASAGAPDASTTVKGIVELATNAETATGTDAVRAVTPAGLASLGLGTPPPDASATVKGIVELATDGETTTGTDTVRATTPANVKAAIDARTASASAQGIVELATDAETLTGTDAARAVTPAGLASLKGVANGFATLDGSSKIPAIQIPGSYDDVLEFANLAAFPGTGETGKIYVALDTNLTYRWTGSVYGVLDPSLALGSTSTTAHRGDHGAAAYTHSQITSGNPHGTTAADVGALSTANAGDHTTDFAAGFVAALA